MKENEIMKMLYDVKHPGKGDRNIVELGIVDKVEIDGDKVTLTLAFPKHRDPLTEYIVGSAKAAIYRQAPEVKEVIVNAIVREESAPKKQTGLNLSLDEVNNVRHIIGVASGKGGVGKSTVAVNLAVALARLGYKVGLADADVYGPSVPKMTATEGAIPEAVKEDDKEIIMPIEKYGVKWMSIGYFAEPGQALIWRGPMACNALKQMILQVRWGNLDFLLIDMPPGTGDVALTVFQSLPVDGIVIVTSPQDLVSMIVAKAVNMAGKMNVPILGIVENMSYIECPDCGKKIEVFGKSKLPEVAERYNLEILGQLPINPALAEACDKGEVETALPDGMLPPAVSAVEAIAPHETVEA